MKLKPIWIVHTLVVIAVAVCFALQHMELSSTYKKGVAAAEAGNYEEAYNYMNSIAEYRDAPTKAEDYQLEINYQYVCQLIDESKWDEALTQVELIKNIRDYKDIEDIKYKCLYEQAKQLSFNGELHSAELIYIRLPLEFEDVAERKSIIANFKKFAGSWRCDENNLDLKTTVYIDYDNIPRVKATLSDADGLLLDEPITLNGEGMEIKTDRFSWAIYGTDSYSFVYGKDAYTVMKQPVVEGTTKYSFKRVTSADYDKLNSQYMSTEF